MMTQFLIILTRFFGWDAESTEQEVHQHLTDLPGTIQEYRDQIRTEMRTEVSAGFEQRITELETENTALQTGEAEQRSQIERLNARITELEAENATLRKQPAANHTAGAADVEAGDKKTKYDPNRSPVTARAMQSFN